MSTTDAPGRREVAHRLFAAEFMDTTLSYSESDEERAPNYVVTPTGARVNRLFVAGVLTEVERVNDDTLRGRVVDPTGAFVTYAGQYQPEEQTFLDTTTPPAFVALTGKARTFEPEDSDIVYTSVRPERLSTIDADTRDHSIVTTARATLDRIAVFKHALESHLRGEELTAALHAGGASPSLAAGIPRAIDHYGTTEAYLEAVRQLAVQALNVVAGNREAVESLEVSPDEQTATTIGSLPETSVTIEAATVQPDSVAEAADEPAVTEQSESIDDSVSAVSIEEPSAESTHESEPRSGSESEARAELDEKVDAEPTQAQPVETEEHITEEPTVESTAIDDAEPIGDFEDISMDSPEDSPETESETDTETVDDEVDAELDGMYELDAEEREAVEEEFGTEFSTGGEVDDPGEAGIDVPDVDELADAMEAAEADEVVEDDAETAKTENTGELGDFEDIASNDADTTAEETPSESVVEPETASQPEVETEPKPEPELAESEPETELTEPDDTDSSTAGEPEPSAVNLEDAAIDVMQELNNGDGAERSTVVETVTDRYNADPDAVDSAIHDALLSGRCYEPTDGVLKAI